MAGLVDYVVDSEKESEDEKPKNSPIRKARQTSENGNRSSPVKPSLKREPSESKKQSSKEVQESNSKETRGRDRESREHRHKHHKRSRSRSRDRDRKRDREKERDKDQKRSSHHRDRRRSRSHSKDRKNNKHKDERKRHRHRSSSKSRSRSKSRSPSRDKHHKSSRRERSQERREKKQARLEAPIAAADAPTDQPRATSSSSLVQAPAQPTGQRPVSEQPTVAVPSFYNPNAVNASRVAQQLQKRKLLWSHKEKEPTASTAAKLWESTAFSQDQDGKMTAKFKRLMGIKSDPASAPAPAEGPSDVLKKQKELFASLDQQYAVARAATHTQRGLGLGFSSNAR